jgi:hypothetical protein
MIQQLLQCKLALQRSEEPQAAAEHAAGAEGPLGSVFRAPRLSTTREQNDQAIAAALIESCLIDVGCSRSLTSR